MLPRGVIGLLLVLLYYFYCCCYYYYLSFVTMLVFISLLSLFIFQFWLVSSLLEIQKSISSWTLSEYLRKPGLRRHDVKHNYAKSAGEECEYDSTNLQRSPLFHNGITQWLLLAQDLVLRDRAVNVVELLFLSSLLARPQRGICFARSCGRNRIRSAHTDGC